MTVSKYLNFYHVIYFYFATKNTGLRNDIHSSLDMYQLSTYGAEIANPNVKSIFHGKLEKKITCVLLVYIRFPSAVLRCLSPSK